MLVKVALLLAGLALGGAATAAATSTVWHGGGRTYKCEGAVARVECAEVVRRTSYRIQLVPGRVLVSFGDEVIFECERKLHPHRNCRYYGASPPAPDPAPGG